MFITKYELKNTMQLIRVKLSGVKSVKSLIGIGIICVIFFERSIPFFIRLFEDTDWVRPFLLQDTSVVLMVLGLLGVITYKNCRYRQINQSADVYPQTGVSRFLSTHAMFYIWIVSAALLYTLLYLAEYAAFTALAAFRGNIHLIYKYDIGFFLAGFVVMIIYTSIITAGSSLTAALIRKFRFYAIAFFALVFGLIFADVQLLLQFIGPVMQSLITEQYLLYFILKGAGLCLVLFILTLIVTRHTAYYRDAARIVNISVNVITPACIIALVYIFAIWEGNYKEQKQIERTAAYRDRIAAWEKMSEAEQLNIRNEWRDYRGYGEIIIDASAVPKGSKINVNDIDQPKCYKNNIITINGSIITSICNGRFKLNYDKKELSDFRGDQLLVSYLFPEFYFPSNDYRYKVDSFANMRVSARLEAATLYIDYTYDKNIKTVQLMSFQPFLQQFGYYKKDDAMNEYYQFVIPSELRTDGSISIKVLPEF